MSTRSSIAIENEDGSITGIYKHSYGYISYTGKILLDKFNSEEKAKKLIMLGGLSWIDEEGKACAYHRDRGEAWEDNKPITSDNWEEHQKILSQEYDYVWSDGKWFVADVYDTNQLVELELAVTQTA